MIEKQPVAGVEEDPGEKQKTSWKTKGVQSSARRAEGGTRDDQRNNFELRPEA